MENEIQLYQDAIVIIDARLLNGKGRIVSLNEKFGLFFLLKNNVRKS